MGNKNRISKISPQNDKGYLRRLLLKPKMDIFPYCANGSLVNFHKSKNVDSYNTLIERIFVIRSIKVS